MKDQCIIFTQSRSVLLLKKDLHKLALFSIGNACKIGKRPLKVGSAYE